MRAQAPSRQGLAAGAQRASFWPAQRARACARPRLSATAIEVAAQPLQYEKELTSAKEAVRLASRLCTVVQRQLSLEEKADKKDASPVTVADYGAQAVVAWVLQRADPSLRLSMVAEEDSAELATPGGRPMLERITQLINSVITEADPAAKLTPEEVLKLIDLGNSQGGPSGRHWVLDPIDGTRGFVGMRQYAVCLGMLQQGEVVLGVLGCPNLPQGDVEDDAGGAGAASRSGDEDVGALFWAHRGAGAYAEPLCPQQGDPAGSAPQRIHVVDLADSSQARFMESMESRHSSHGTASAMAKELGIVRPSLRMDSQVKYGLLSRGVASIFMRFPPRTYKEKIWDHAAGFVIVEEAGGKVTDAGGVRLDFSKGRFLDLGPFNGIIAAPPKLHAQLVAAAARVVGSEADTRAEKMY
ncbi:hypothetical protein HYH03_006221 [Edaphochlamys debaryana]|uniref:3'(2'),5'-bisphosphate nucleotidase n=1 Tax=Edaphochlamys debaryana TaxID=47281 RepID=A0A835Y7I9_9CHLO|nr:hypothetical protein HYH03_006221 [Edaphochlamys debaryana]|eukprot:KAG2495621.1 hypothetical protein HYH03_006221 [Edaphochlamys debaryana]